MRKSGIYPENPGVIDMEQIAEIRRCYFINEESISKIAKRLNLSRQTVRRALKSQEQPVYQRNVQPTPKLGSFKQQLVSWLEFDAKLPRRQRRTAQRLYECLQVEGYQGSYGPVQRLYETGSSKHRTGQRQPRLLFLWRFRQVKPVSLIGAMNMSY